MNVRDHVHENNGLNMYALNMCSNLQRFVFALVVAVATVFAAQPVSAGTPCKADEHTGYGPESEVPSDNDYFPHMYVAQVADGAFRSKRYCHDVYDAADVTQLFAFGKKSGELVSSGSSRDLQIFDEEGRIRIIESWMAENFSRETIFDQTGTLIFYSYTSDFAPNELVVPEGSKTISGPRSPTEDINHHLLALYSASKFPKVALLTWLQQYHGEGPGMTLEGQLRDWKAAHPEDYERLFKLPASGQ